MARKKTTNKSIAQTEQTIDISTTGGGVSLASLTESVATADVSSEREQPSYVYGAEATIDNSGYVTASLEELVTDAMPYAPNSGMSIGQLVDPSVCIDYRQIKRKKLKATTKDGSVYRFTGKPEQFPLVRVKDNPSEKYSNSQIVYYEDIEVVNPQRAVTLILDDMDFKCDVVVNDADTSFGIIYDTVGSQGQEIKICVDASTKKSDLSFNLIVRPDPAEEELFKEYINPKSTLSSGEKTSNNWQWTSPDTGTVNNKITSTAAPKPDKDFNVDNKKTTVAGKSVYFLADFTVTNMTHDITLTVRAKKNQRAKIIVFSDGNVVGRNNENDSIILLSPQTQGQYYTDRKDPFNWDMNFSLINTVKYEKIKFSWLGESSSDRYKDYKKSTTGYWATEDNIDKEASSTDGLNVSSSDSTDYGLSFSIDRSSPKTYYAAVYAKKVFKSTKVKIYISYESLDGFQVSTPYIQKTTPGYISVNNEEVKATEVTEGMYMARYSLHEEDMVVDSSSDDNESYPQFIIKNVDVDTTKYTNVYVSGLAKRSAPTVLPD